MNTQILVEKVWGILKFNLVLVTLLLIGFVVNFAKTNKLELKPLRLNLWDAVTIGDKIIVYGSLGQILVSTDFGNSWKQQSVDDYSNIRKIINLNDTLWGILENCSVFWSVDQGLTWEKFKLSIDDTLLNFLPYNDKFILRGTKSIYFVDRNFRIVNIYSNDTLQVIPALSDYDDLAQPYYSFSSSNLLLFGNKIIISTPQYSNSGFGYYDMEQNKFFFVNLNEIITKTNTFLDFYPLDLFQIDNETILQITSNLYVIDSTLSTFKYFFKDSIFANFFDTTWRNLDKIWRLDWTSYFVIDNNLFVMQDIDSMRNDSIYYGRLWDGKRVLKYIKDNPIDTFVPVGEIFKNVYLASLPYGYTWYNPILGRYLSKPSASCKDSVWVYPLKSTLYSFRTILLSDFNFNRWKLVSFLKGFPIKILNDSIYFFFWTDVQSFYLHRSELFFSFDSGQTFQPLIRYNPTIDSLPLSLQGFYEVYCFELDSTGKGFILGNPPEYGYALVRTDDFWKTFYSPKTHYDFPRYFQSTNFVNIDTSYFFVLYKTSRSHFGLSYQSWFYLLDTSFNNALRLRVDTFVAVQYILPYKNEHILFCLVNDSIQPLKNYFEIRKTANFGKSYEVLYRGFSDWSFVQFYEHNRDSVFFTTEYPNRLYLYIPSSNELKLLWEAEEGDYRPLLMVISDRFYLVGRGLFLENTDRSDLTQWRPGQWDYGTPNFESVIFRGNVAIAGLSDSLRPFNYYKITLKRQEPSVVREPVVEKRYYTTHFWASEPYPQPASVRVRARVVWDGSFDLREAIDGVYDSMGRKVEGKERIRVDARSTTSGELEWECSGVPAGIYFILIRWQGGSDTVPVVVE